MEIVKNMIAEFSKAKGCIGVSRFTDGQMLNALCLKAFSLHLRALDWQTIMQKFYQLHVH